MGKDIEFDRIADAVAVDDYGTIRVDESFGTIAIYVKVDDNTWQTIYVNPRRGNNFGVPKHRMSDRVAGMYPIVFAPKPVE